MKLSRAQLRKMINETIKKTIPAHQIRQGMGFYNMDDTVAVRIAGEGEFARGYMYDNLPTAQEVADVLMRHYMISQQKGNLEQGGLIDVANAVKRLIPPADPSRSFVQGARPFKADKHDDQLYYEPNDQDFDILAKKVTDILIEAKLIINNNVPMRHIDVIYDIVKDGIIENLKQIGYVPKFDHFQV